MQHAANGLQDPKDLFTTWYHFSCLLLPTQSVDWLHNINNHLSIGMLLALTLTVRLCSVVTLVYNQILRLVILATAEV